MVLSLARGSHVHSQVAPSSSDMMRPKLVARMMRWGWSAGSRTCNESGKAPSARAGPAAASHAIKNANTGRSHLQRIEAHGERTNDDLCPVGIVCWGESRTAWGALLPHARA